MVFEVLHRQSCAACKTLSVHGGLVEADEKPASRFKLFLQVYQVSQPLHVVKFSVNSSPIKKSLKALHSLQVRCSSVISAAE